MTRQILLAQNFLITLSGKVPMILNNKKHSITGSTFDLVYRRRNFPVLVRKFGAHNI